MSSKEIRNRARTSDTDASSSRLNRSVPTQSKAEGQRFGSSHGNGGDNGNDLREKHDLRDQLNKAREVSNMKQLQRGKGGAVFLIALLAVIGSILIGVVFGGWYMLIRSPGPKVEQGKEVAVIIPEGAGVGTIADILVEKGIVANPNMFKIMTRLKNADAVYHSGRYLLITGSGYDVAIAALSKAPDPVEVVKVQIIEGLRIDAIARSVADQLGISAAEFEDRALSAAPDYAEKYPYLADAYNGSLEGFLFPETYEFEVNATVDDVIERMLAQFDSVWTSLEVPAERIERYGVPQLVTIASLCEREAMLGDERPLVASVIENRLAIDMRLEFCSTVQFLLPPERQNVVPLLFEDLEIVSPFNTYKNAGLPPGPICSPSKSSLEAAARPASTDFLFFVLTGLDGSQTFTRTYEEHNAAAAQSEVF
jgi:UPF0755 protein